MSRKANDKTTWPIVAAARQLRRKPTEAEELLWDELRSGRLSGLKFRRQHPFGPFVLDFFCKEHQLCIEVDGAIHADPAQAARDTERTAFLVERGVRVMRFSNEQVLHHLSDVLKQILASTQSSP